MAEVLTQLELLTEHMMGSTLKAANVVVSKWTRAYDNDDM